MKNHQLLNLEPEEIEIQLINIFLKEGYSKSSFLMEEIWAIQFPEEYRHTKQFIRARILLRPGIQKRCQEILEDNTLQALKERKIMLTRDLVKR